MASLEQVYAIIVLIGMPGIEKHLARWLRIIRVIGGQFSTFLIDQLAHVPAALGRRHLRPK
jgi:hypothetical protein